MLMLMKLDYFPIPTFGRTLKRKANGNGKGTTMWEDFSYYNS